MRGSGNNLTRMDSVIFITQNAARAQILNNNIFSKAFGIWVDGARGVRILGNHIQGDNTIRSQDRGNGVHLFNTTGAEVADNDIWHTRDGIYIDTSNHNILKNNHLHHLRYGIHYMYSHHNQVIGNRTNDTRTGYALMQSNHLTVINNHSLDDDNYGILLNYIINSSIENNYVTSVSSISDSEAGIKQAPGIEGKALFVY
ncbi:MAG: copper-binding protein, partial [Gammaproteobacteria bacterium]|nr:copper-binding protein [Gammaproteobacteria bacterium]